MSFLKSLKMLLGGEEPRINPNDLKKLSPEKLEDMITEKRTLMIKEYKLKQKNGELGSGLVGLRNLGNTCFMNAALQCLSNIGILTEYLLTEDWEDSINSVSTIAEGRLVCEYYSLLVRMWKENHNSVSPGDVKKAITRVSRTFAGYSQQDTQEFLAYFLDALHEDLNQVYVKPYIQQKDYAGEPIKQFATEAWQNHTQRNRSFIVDNFHGQYFSKIRCPDCKHESVTCDPFDMLSLNISAKERIKIEGYIMAYTYDRDTHGFNFNVDGSVTLDKLLPKIVQEWNRSLTSEEGKLELDNVSPFYFTRSRIVERLQKPYDRITAKEIMANDGIFFILEHYSVIYAPLVFKEEAAKLLPKLDQTHTSIRMSLQVLVKDKSIAVEKEVSVPESLTAYQLYFLIYVIHRKSFLSASCKGADLIQSKAEPKDLEAEFRQFFPAENIDLTSALFIVSLNSKKVLNICENIQIVSGDYKGKLNAVVTLNENLFPAEPKLKSCKKLYINDLMSTDQAQSLYGCLDHFVAEEKLDKDNMWYCPKCKSHKEAFKKMAIMRHPKILIVHLKRFKKEIYRQHLVGFRKNSEIINFPLDNLDVSKYVVDLGNSKVSYSLFGVANHFGSCGGGHYTAFCKNSYTKEWYNFDDSDVSKVAETEIVSDAAYVLFYKLKQG